MFSFKNWIKFLIEHLFSLNGCSSGTEVTPTIPQSNLKVEDSDFVIH